MPKRKKKKKISGKGYVVPERQSNLRNYLKILAQSRILNMLSQFSYWREKRAFILATSTSKL